jgi:hypothetical protein
MVSWNHIEAAFNKSIRNIDPVFFDTIPDGCRHRIRTTLKNVILNGVIIYIKHLEGTDFILEKEADAQLYFLDALTPAPAFIGLEKPEINIPGSKRHKVGLFRMPSHVELVDSDGEIECVEILH